MVSVALRLVELTLPVGNDKLVDEVLEGLRVEEKWVLKISDDRTMYRILVPWGASGPLIDGFTKRFGNIDGYRIMVHSIAASIPGPKDEETPRDQKSRLKDVIVRKIGRISREELYLGTSDATMLTYVYLATVALSVIVAAIGLAESNIVMIIGAMVISPLLGPSMALSMATTVADVKLAMVSIRTLVISIALATTLSLIMGYYLSVDPTIPEIASTTNVGLSDICVALASGSAGALFLTIGFSTALVGVMVAVSLLPPLVTFGLLIGVGEFDLALDAALLFATNLICINLSGVVTFVAQGVRPRSWWEADKAKTLTIWAVLIWCALLAFLTMLIVLWGGFDF